MADINGMNNPSNSVEQNIFNQQQAQREQENAAEKQGPDAEYNQVASMITDLDRRLRTLEERYSNLRKKIQLTDQNLLESERSFSKELKGINDESMTLKRSIGDFSDKIVMFENEMGNVAQKMDLKVIEKYFNMWNPSNFVTRTELRDYLKSHKVKSSKDETP